MEPETSKRDYITAAFDALGFDTPQTAIRRWIEDTHHVKVFPSHISRVKADLLGTHKEDLVEFAKRLGEFAKECGGMKRLRDILNHLVK